VGPLRAEPNKRKGTQISFQKKAKPFGFLYRVGYGYRLMAACCQKLKLSFLRKLQLNSSVNSSDFVCNFTVMCFIPCLCRITLMLLTNLQEETGGILLSTILFKIIVFYWMCHRNDKVTTNTSFITVLLKHIFFLSFTRIYHNYLLFVLDLLDHQPA
jgi:hypothetical protein